MSVNGTPSLALAGGKAPVSVSARECSSRAAVSSVRPRRREIYRNLRLRCWCCTASATASGFSAVALNAAIATGKAARAAALGGTYCWRNNTQRAG